VYDHFTNVRKLIFIILFIAGAFGLYFIIGHYFPKSVGRYPVFVVLFLLDLYLYSSYHKKIWSWKKVKATFITFLYWSPAIAIAMVLLGSMLFSFENWNKGFRNYLIGFILIGFASKVIPIIMLVIADLIRFIKLISRSKTRAESETKANISRSVFLKRLGLAGGGLLFGTLLFGMIKWVYDFKIWKETIRLSNLPKSFNGFKIVQFSDIHLGNWNSKKELEEAVRVMNEQQPDVIFFTGDLVNYTTDEAFEFEEIFKGLKAKYGIYAVLGNHDYGDYKRWDSKAAKARNMKELYDYYKRLGWKLLLNENHTIKIGEEEIAIVGVENWGSLSRFQKYGDLDKAIKGVQEIPVKLLLSHDPSHWELIASKYKSTIDVTFAGHTHGAQFGIEIPGMRWSPAQYIYHHWAGLYSKVNPATKSEQYLYVNRGIGTIGYPGRVGILPEITVVELQS